MQRFKYVIFMVLLTNNWRHSYVNRWIGMENCYYSISIGVHYNWIYITIPLLQYYEWIGLREPSQENPMIFMGKSMVSGFDFPLDQSKESQDHHTLLVLLGQNY